MRFTEIIMTKPNLASSIANYPAGSILIHENELSRKMYILVSGKVRVYKTYMNKKISLAVLGAGEIFGEFSFFDAQPRSATVEALSDVKAYVIDGELASQQIKDLPEWVMPVLKKVLDRFRDADQRLTVLQSMNDFEKRHYKNDSVAQMIYQELNRFLRALRLIFERDSKTGNPVNSNQFFQELDAFLGNRTISLPLFWKILRENGYMTVNETGHVSLMKDQLDPWQKYLEHEMESGAFTLLSHSTVALLRRIISFVDVGDLAKPNQPLVKINRKDLGLDAMVLADEAIAEAQAKGLLTFDGPALIVNPSQIAPVYYYQSLLKAFDHSIAQLD